MHEKDRHLYGLMSVYVFGFIEKDSRHTREGPGVDENIIKAFLPRIPQSRT